MRPMVWAPGRVEVEPWRVEPDEARGARPLAACRGMPAAVRSLGLPVPLPLTKAASHITAQSQRAEILRRARLMVWDEALQSQKSA